MDNRPHVLILGSDSSAAQLLGHRNGSSNGDYKILGCMSLNGSHPTGPQALPILGNSKLLRDYIFENPVDVVLLTSSLAAPLSTELLAPVLEIGLSVAVPQGVKVALEPGIGQKLFTQRQSFLGTDTDFVSTLANKKSYLFLKRVFDATVSAALLLILSPLLFLIALAIKISSPRAPVLYRLDWVGKNGRPFTGYKFRTMVPDADKLKKDLLAFNEMQGPVFKMRKDPRVLPFGRFLRKFSLDELPQLYSVLKGDLSLVGPRAPLREEAQRYEFWQRRKLCVKPGITCLWQIKGRGQISKFDEWVRLDLDYIRNASFLLDLKILLQTIPAVISGRGAS